MKSCRCKPLPPWITKLLYRDVSIAYPKLNNIWGICTPRNLILLKTTLKKIAQVVFALISLTVVQNPKFPTRAPPIFIYFLLSRSHRAWTEIIIMRSDIISRVVQFGVRTIFKVRGLTRTFMNFEKRGFANCMEKIFWAETPQKVHLSCPKPPKLINLNDIWRILVQVSRLLECGAWLAH